MLSFIWVTTQSTDTPCIIISTEHVLQTVPHTFDGMSQSVTSLCIVSGARLILTFPILYLSPGWLLRSEASEASPPDQTHCSRPPRWNTTPCRSCTPSSRRSWQCRGPHSTGWPAAGRGPAPLSSSPKCTWIPCLCQSPMTFELLAVAQSSEMLPALLPKSPSTGLGSEQGQSERRRHF